MNLVKKIITQALKCRIHQSIVFNALFWNMYICLCINHFISDFSLPSFGSEKDLTRWFRPALDNTSVLHKKTEGFPMTVYDLVSTAYSIFTCFHIGPGDQKRHFQVPDHGPRCLVWVL